jgi:GH15 family glucan-1,4-alpha-glucosidase
VSTPIEAYALLADGRGAALVDRAGRIDWLCLPRYDSPAVFAALLGDDEHGYWTIAAPDGTGEPSRRYRDDSLVLETDLVGPAGRGKLIDFMPVDEPAVSVVRRVECTAGTLRVGSELNLRDDYGRAAPRLRRDGERLIATCSSGTLTLDGTRRHEAGRDDILRCAFDLEAGDSASFRLCASQDANTAPDEAEASLTSTERWWSDWASRCSYTGDYADVVRRSLVAVRGLIYAPSGGILAAPTTSLPEQLGGDSNWDYRYCWIRDATFTLMALLETGYEAEATAWREWLLRVLDDKPDALQVLYGVEGERKIDETEIDLPGYAGSRPVRIGNLAYSQHQLDICGEIMDAIHQSRVAAGGDLADDVWRIQRALLEHLESAWKDKDCGIWEDRGPEKHRVHSKVMSWVAFDRGIDAIDNLGQDGPVQRWRGIRDQIREEILTRGFNAEGNHFTRSYDSTELDAALLLIAPVGFLPADDPRVLGTVAAIERELTNDGLVRRYDPASGDRQNPFFACSFWLADNYLLQGREDDARNLFERLIALTNDVGLLSEEYDAEAGRQVGNFPQVFSHVALINTACSLAGDGTAHKRAGGSRGQRVG